MYYLVSQEEICCSNSCWHIKYRAQGDADSTSHQNSRLHHHEPNRLSLLSSTYRRQIRQLESGLCLLMWQISEGWGGDVSNSSASIHHRPRTQPPVWDFNVTFHFQLLCKGKFWSFRPQSVLCLWLEVSKNMFWEDRKSTCLPFVPHSGISHTVRRRATFCSDIREAVSLHLLGFHCWRRDCWRGYRSQIGSFILKLVCAVFDLPP